MEMPWADIYSEAMKFAQETTVNEEAYRIIEENYIKINQALLLYYPYFYIY